MFVTSTDYTGSIGGQALSGADAACTQGRGRRPPGRHLQRLDQRARPPANGALSAINRVGTGAYVRVDGQTVATQRRVLTRAGLYLPIDLTEWGAKRDTSVWTGTDSTGRRDAKHLQRLHQHDADGHVRRQLDRSTALDDDSNSTSAAPSSPCTASRTTAPISRTSTSSATPTTAATATPCANRRRAACKASAARRCSSRATASSPATSIQRQRRPHPGRRAVRHAGEERRPRRSIRGVDQLEQRTGKQAHRRLQLRARRRQADRRQPEGAAGHGEQRPAKRDLARRDRPGLAGRARVDRLGRQRQSVKDANGGPLTCSDWTLRSSDFDAAVGLVSATDTTIPADGVQLARDATDLRLERSQRRHAAL